MVIQDLQITRTAPPFLHCDNISALSFAANPGFHACSKHIEVDFHYVKERIENKQLKVVHVASVD